MTIESALPFLGAEFLAFFATDLRIAQISSRRSVRARAAWPTVEIQQHERDDREPSEQMRQRNNPDDRGEVLDT